MWFILLKAALKWPADVLFCFFLCAGPDVCTHQTDHHENSLCLLSNGHRHRGQHGHRYGSKCCPWTYQCLNLLDGWWSPRSDWHALMHRVLPANRWHRLHPPQLHSRVPGQRSPQSQGSDYHDLYGTFLSFSSFMPSCILPFESSFVRSIIWEVFHSSVFLVSSLLFNNFPFLLFFFSLLYILTFSLKNVEACFCFFPLLPLFLF